MIWNALIIALREIRRNLTRAFLTVLGVIIGVAAVITMVSLGDGATEVVKQQISNLGSNLLVLRPGAGFGSRVGSAGVPRLSEADAEAIRHQVPGVVNVAPVRQSNFNTVYLQKARSTGVTGSTLDYFPINKWVVAEGREFTEREAEAGDAVCVIGETVRKELFEGANPIGEKIRIGTATFEVIGILKSKGQMGMGDQDDTIIVPLRSLKQRLLGYASMNDINMITISAADGTDSDKLIAEINSLMRQRRKLQPNQDNNFNVFDTRQIADTLSASTKTMTMLLAAVAGVSLLVGGIGIMNIMLVSVTERTREIGIRLAIGATSQEVLTQFLVEAVTLSCIGGLIGMGLAYGLCLWLAGLIHVPYTFNSHINLLAFSFSAAIGILFGFAPARRAARLDPIEALRHE